MGSFNRWVSAIRSGLSTAFALGGLLLISSLSSAAGFSPASSCNPLAQETCGLPFPSDVFRNNFGRYNFSDTIFDKRTSGMVRTLLPARTQYPSSFQPSKIFNDSTGFSALGPVLFELNDWPFSDIPKDGEGFLHVYNMATGERVPMIVSLSDAAQPQRDFRESRPVIIGWPRSRFEFGEKYVAVLLKSGLNNAFNSGGVEVFTPTEGVRKALEGSAGWVLNYVYGAPLKAISDIGIDNNDVLSFTWFTVRKESEVVEPVLGMVNKALAYPNYVDGFNVSEPLGDSEYGLVTLKGEMSLVNFRSPDGGVYEPYDYIPDLSRRRTEFVLSLPKWDKAAPIPISVWGHGLANYKEVTRTGFIMGDRLGMATIAIDHPNHGSRVTPYDSFREPHIATAVTSPLTIMQLLGMFVQATVDHNVVIHSSKYKLPDALASWTNDDYPNVPALDGSRIIYDGLSLGGMLGVAIGATAPELQGAYLVNGAGSLMQVFSESTFWDDFTSNVIPQNMNGAELTFVLAMMQHYVDIADGNNFAHLYRNPPAGYEARAMGMHYSLGDGSMPNDASLAAAEIADLPLLKEVIEPEENLRVGTEGIEGFEGGYGLVQSGFGYEQADQSIEILREFDIESTLGLDDVSVFDELLGVDLSNLPLGIPFADQLTGLLGEDEASSIDNVVDLIYDGDLEAFLTHFNRGGEGAVHHAIDWRCDLLSLDQERCVMAKQKATEDAEDGNSLPDVIGGGTDNPIDDLGDMINDGLQNIQVTEGSAGAVEWAMLALLMVLVFYRHALTRVKIISRCRD
jgi:pimeloyl-ACP methyl ester carboxylesterase